MRQDEDRGRVSGVCIPAHRAMDAGIFVDTQAFKMQMQMHLQVIRP